MTHNIVSVYANMFRIVSRFINGVASCRLYEAHLYANSYNVAFVINNISKLRGGYIHKYIYINYNIPYKVSNINYKRLLLVL